MDFPRAPLAVGLGRLVVAALERAREVQRVAEARAVGDLAHREIGEAQQPRRLEHHALGDEVLGRAAGDVRQRARQGRGGHAERSGVVRGVVVAREVLLEPAREAAVELHLGVVGRAALGARGVVPALDPEQDRREQVALDLGAVLVGRALELGVEGVDQRVEARRLGRRDRHRAAALARQQPFRRAAPRAALHQPLLAEAHDRAVQVLAALEHVHLAAADHRHRQRPHGHGRAVDRMLPAARADPDQLVVVVPVRLALRRPAEARSLEPHDLDRAAVEAVEGEAAHAAPQSVRRRRWRQRKAASKTSACSPPAARRRGRTRPRRPRACRPPRAAAGCGRGARPSRSRAATARGSRVRARRTRAPGRRSRRAARRRAGSTSGRARPRGSRPRPARSCARTAPARR